MNTRPLALLVLAALLALPARAAVLEDFSGYKPGDSFTTGQTLGAAGDLWTGGWRTASSYVETTGRIEAAKPPGAGQYLSVTLVAADGQPQNPSGAIGRPWHPPAKPFTLSFRFRPATPDKGLRYFIFDNATRAAGPGPDATWQIESHEGFWRLIDGEGGGLPAVSIDTDLPVTAGVTCTFTLAIDPVLRTWDAVISDGTRTVAHKGLHFRTAGVTPERWLHFGASALSAPAPGLTIGYSLDSLSIQP